MVPSCWVVMGGNFFESPTIRTGNKRVAPLISLHLLNISSLTDLTDTRLMPATHGIQKAAGDQAGLLSLPSSRRVSQTPCSDFEGKTILSPQRCARSEPSH